MTEIDIRPATPDDISVLMGILEGSGLFGPDDLPGMEDHIRGDFEGTGGIWLIAGHRGRAVGAAMHAADGLGTEVRNLLFLGVLEEARGRGVATALISRVEQASVEAGVRLVLIETSSDAAQAPARSLYAGLGYRIDGRIRGYYAPGEDKIVFRKTL